MGSKRIIMIMIRKIYLTVVVLSSLALSGCTGIGLVTGAAAVTGVAAAQEGGINRAVSDTKIKLKINEAWFQYNVNIFRKLGTTVNQGRVLVTGVVQDPQHRVEAIRLAWQVEGVKQVINEIRIADSKGITGYVKDKWIKSRLRGALTFDRSVQSINYSIDTVQGVVYLMGVAQNQAELNRVIETARTISGVKQVVSYVKLAGEPLAGQQNATAVQETNVTAQPVQPSYQTNQQVNQSIQQPQDIHTDNNDDAYYQTPLDVPQTTNQPSIADQYYR